MWAGRGSTNHRQRKKTASGRRPNPYFGEEKSTRGPTDWIAQLKRRSEILISKSRRHAGREAAFNAGFGSRAPRERPRRVVLSMLGEGTRQYKNPKPRLDSGGHTRCMRACGCMGVYKAHSCLARAAVFFEWMIPRHPSSPTQDHALLGNSRRPPVCVIG